MLHSKDDKDRSLCRVALGLHPDRREGKIQLRHGMMLQLSYLDPVEMLSGRQAELEATAKAQEVARKTGKAARKIKVKKEGAAVGGGGGTAGGVIVHGNRKVVASSVQGQKARAAASTALKRKKMIDKLKEEEANDDDHGQFFFFANFFLSFLLFSFSFFVFFSFFSSPLSHLWFCHTELLLLQAIKERLFWVNIQWMVGGATMELGPITTRHVIADLAVLLERATGIQVSNQRMMYQGIMVQLHQRADEIGLSEHSTDPIFLTVLTVDDFEMEEEDGLRVGEMTPEFVVVGSGGGGGKK